MPSWLRPQDQGKDKSKVKKFRLSYSTWIYFREELHEYYGWIRCASSCLLFNNNLASFRDRSVCGSFGNQQYTSRGQEEAHPPVSRVTGIETSVSAPDVVLICGHPYPTGYSPGVPGKYYLNPSLMNKSIFVHIRVSSREILAQCWRGGKMYEGGCIGQSKRNSFTLPISGLPPDCTTQGQERPSWPTISSRGSDSLWVSMWLLQLCGMLSKRHTVFLPHPECWFTSCMTSLFMRGWEGRRSRKDSFKVLIWCRFYWLYHRLHQEAHPWAIGMPHPQVLPTGQWAPSVLCTPYQYRSPHCGQWAMYAPNQGSECKLGQAAWKHTESWLMSAGQRQTINFCVSTSLRRKKGAISTQPIVLQDQKREFCQKMY